MTVISGCRTKLAVVAKYRAKITVHRRGFWLPYKNYCGDQLPCNNYRALPWWLATVQSIPWLPITVHQLLSNTVVAVYRGKRYRDEKSLPRKALEFCFIGLWYILYRGQYNTVQYSTVVIIYDNALHPMFTPDPCDYSRDLAVFCFF